MSQRTEDIALCYYRNNSDDIVTAKILGLKPSTVRRKIREFKQSNSQSTPAKILLIDVENSRIKVDIWDTGKQYVRYDQVCADRYIICWCAKWLYSSEIFGDCVTPKESINRNDKRIIKTAWDIMDEADIIIGHNVKNFDIPKLNARILLNDTKGGIPPSPYNIVDTLITSRVNFSLISHSQDFLTKCLKLPQKLKTEQELWTRCEKGEQKALDYMYEYCSGDINGLEEVYLKLRPWVKSHPNVALYGDLEDMNCPVCGSTEIKKQGKYVTPMNVYDSYRCECGAISRARKSNLKTEQRKHLFRSRAK